MATGDRNYDIAKETTSQNILNAVGLLGGSGAIKSIQKGSTLAKDGTYAKTITISPVNESKSIAFTFAHYSNSDQMMDVACGAKVTSDTTLTLYANVAYSTSAAYGITHEWVVIEFN